MCLPEILQQRDEVELLRISLPPRLPAFSLPPALLPSFGLDSFHLHLQTHLHSLLHLLHSRNLHLLQTQTLKRQHPNRDR